MEMGSRENSVALNICVNVIVLAQRRLCIVPNKRDHPRETQSRNRILGQILQGVPYFRSHFPRDKSPEFKEEEDICTPERVKLLEGVKSQLETG